jgi:hypothetical protein
MRGIIEHTEIRINHLIIFDKEESWDDNGALLIGLKHSCSAGKRLEVLLNQVNKLLMIHTNGTHDDDVFSEIVSLEIVDNHVMVDLIDVIDATEDELSHHFIYGDVIIHVLHQSFYVIVVVCFQLLPDGVLFHFKVIVVIIGVANHVTQISTDF